MPRDQLRHPAGCNMGVEVKLVDFFLWYELVDLDCALALDRYGLKLLGTDLDVGAFANLVPLDDLFGIDLFARFSIDFAILHAVAGFLVQLMEADLLSL